MPIATVRQLKINETDRLDCKFASDDDNNNVEEIIVNIRKENNKML
jgi:hypothetical protein